MQGLIVKALTKQYQSKVAVDHIDLEVRPGQLVAFLGPNGAGKSTTISMLIGLLTPTAGTIRLDGLAPTSQDYHRRIGVVFQNSVLDGAMTVRQNLNSRAKMYHNVPMSRVTSLSQQLGLTAFLDQPYATLSGGQRRRVDIARAIIHDPEVLFLDEPSTGLDIQTRQVIWNVLTQLRQQHHMTIVLTTHYLEEAEGADYVYVIDHGKVVAADTVPALKQTNAPTLLTVTTAHAQQVQTQLPQTWTSEATDKGLTVAVPDSLSVLSALVMIKPLISAFEIRQGSMDDVFVALTGKEIR